MKKIAIFCGGPSSEHEVSISSATSILNNIDRTKYEVFIFYIQKDLQSIFFKADNKFIIPKGEGYGKFLEVLKKEKDNFDVALLAALHGEFGEDGTVQKVLEGLKITYTGSNSAVSKVCMDKYLTMQKISKIKELSFPKTKKIIIDKNSRFESPFKFPVILKPNSLGSSVLVFIVKNQTDFNNAVKQYIENETKEILVQELIEGLEIQCGCLENSKGKFIELPPVEIRPKADFFDYNSKYDIGGAEEITPPVSISKKESDKISHLTIEIHKLLKCKTYSRTDFMYKDGKIYFLEINTLPGMTATSLLPQEAKAANISFTQLIDFIIEESN